MWSVLLQVHAAHGRHGRRARRARRAQRRGARSGRDAVGEAAVHLAEDSPEQAFAVLAPVIEGAEDAVELRTASIEALLFDAAARGALGDTRAAAQSWRAPRSR